MAGKKTVIVTGASQGIGAAIVQAFLDRGYNVVATSRSASQGGFASSPNLALVDGDIGQAATAEKVAQTAIARFGSIDHVVNNAGIFSSKPFTDYTADEFRGFVSTNLEGFICGSGGDGSCGAAGCGLGCRLGATHDAALRYVRSM